MYKRPDKLLYLLVGTILLPATACAASADPIDLYVRDQMQKLHIPGISLAVVKNDRIVKTAGYGFANLETRTPATPQTVYKTASLSKQFIATAILLLVQQKKIGLDDSVSKYLDDAPSSWKPITIRHLLTHTSGIPSEPPAYHPYMEQPPDEVVKATYSLPLLFRPGEKWVHSNVGYYVLAEIISNVSGDPWDGKVSGDPWDKFIANYLFVPAGMKTARTTTTVAIIPDRASGYDQADGETVNAENWIAVRPSGAFISSVVDLARWDIFSDLHSPLTPSNQKLMRTPATLNDGTAAHYGFGWYIDSYRGRARVHHDGIFPGFRADYERFEKDKVSVIILGNSGTADLEPLALKIVGFYLPLLKASP
jgi:CubicO group peptidase (beta-lactamase class C family)